MAPVRIHWCHPCWCLGTKSCSTLCKPMNCSMPGSSVLHYLLDFPQFMSIEVVMLSIHLILSHHLILCLQSFPASESFPMGQLFMPSGQNTGASASATVLPVNFQNWFSLGLTGLIFFLSKGFWRSLAPQFKSINSLALSLLYDPTLISIHDYWKNYSFDLWQQSDVSVF